MIPEIQQAMRGYSIKKLKTFRGMEGLGFNADLYRDGVLVAQVIDNGDGGSMDFRGPPGQSYRVSDATWDLLVGDALAHEALHRKAGDAAPTLADVSMEVDIFMGSLVDNHESLKRLARLCKTRVVFTHRDDASDSVRETKGAPSPALIAAVRARYGDQILAIVNEEIEAPAPVFDRAASPPATIPVAAIEDEDALAAAAPHP